METDFEYGVDFAQAPPNFTDLRHRVDAALKAMHFCQQEVEVEDADRAGARVALVEGDPNHPELNNAGSVAHLHLLLDSYDKQVVQNAASLRNYITNRLLEESDNADARIRMRSLELLGKISDVGLFTDKTEVTYKHRPTEELEQLLREKLAKVIDADPTEVLQHTEAVIRPADGSDT